MALSDLLLRYAGARRADLAAAGPALEARLAALVEAARARWPAVLAGDEPFMRFLAERLPPDEPPLAALAALHGDDLLLACACAASEPAALRLFDSELLAPVASHFAARAGGGAGGATFAEELKQALRTRLFVREGEGPPRISSYSGQGPLAGWLRTVASRLAVDLQRERAAAGGAGSDQEPAALPAPGPDPELDYLKRLYRRELDEAFRAVLGALPAREATYLRMHYLDGMTMEAIAGLYRVSRRTVHRAITRSRREVFDGTRRLVAERLAIPTAEFDTLMRLARSQLEAGFEAAPLAPKK